MYPLAKWLRARQPRIVFDVAPALGAEPPSRTPRASMACRRAGQPAHIDQETRGGELAGEDRYQALPPAIGLRAGEHLDDAAALLATRARQIGRQECRQIFSTASRPTLTKIGRGRCIAAARSGRKRSVSTPRIHIARCAKPRLPSSSSNERVETIVTAAAA
jgi:hypothetical protein